MHWIVRAIGAGMMIAGIITIIYSINSASSWVLFIGSGCVGAAYAIAFYGR